MDTRLSRPFASQVSFLDPQTKEDGTPYGPWRYREIVKECYAISSKLNTSYTDLLRITPIEREYLIQMLIEDQKKLKEDIDNIKRQHDTKK